MDNSEATIIVGNDPQAVAVNATTNRIYVVNSGSNNVTVINGTNNSTATVSVGTSPKAIAVNASTNRIYVANSGSNNVTVIDGVTNSTSTVTVGTNPVSVAVNSTTNKIYVVNMGSNSVTVIDGANNTTAPVAVGSAPYALAVNATTNRIYVTNQNTNTVTVINGTNNSTASVNVGSNPRSVAINATTNKIYVGNYSGFTVTVIDGTNNSTSTVSVGNFPIAVGVNPVTNKIYVANFQSESVTVIDGTNNSTATVPTGNDPIAITVNSNTNKIYVANFGENSVTVIKGVDNTTAEVSTATFPQALGINLTTNRIYLAGGFPGGSVTVINPTLSNSPFVNTRVATNLTSSGARLNGHVNPGDLPVNVFFEWGTDFSLATYTTTSTQVISANSGAQIASADLSGLAPGTTYAFRVVGTSGAGRTQGEIRQFTSNVTVSGIVTNGNGEPLSGARIQFTDQSTFTNYTSNLTGPSGAYTISDLPFGHNFLALGNVPSTGTDFNVKIYGQSDNVLSPLFGNVSDLNFAKTSPTYAASGTITLNGGGDLMGLTVTPVPPDSPFPSATPCPTPYTAGNFTCNGLWQGTSYDIVPAKPNYVFSPAPTRVTNNITGLSYIGNPLAAVSTTTANPVGQTTATLNGTVNPNGIVTNGWFEWGTDSTLSSSTSTASQSKGSGSTDQPLVQALSSLTAGTTYYFRTVGSNAAGIVRGSIVSFTTTPPKILTVASSNPASGVNVTVTPNDNSSQGSGTTQFIRTYNNNQVVGLTAPSTASGNPFQKWLKDGADFANNTNVNVSVTMDADHVMTAVYIPKTVQFDLSNYIVSELVGKATINVTRSGDTTAAATVNYTTSDTAGASPCDSLNTGKASSRCDYETTLGILKFAANETSKTIFVPIVDDSYFEGNESLTISLSSPSGASLGSPGSATISIVDNESANGPNPINGAEFFVRMHYYDFLNREADTPGLNFWMGQITGCGSNATCTEVQRISVSASFFLSIEFKETGYLVERAYKASYGDVEKDSSYPAPVHKLKVPVIRFNEFLTDTQQITEGVVVLAPGWEQKLESNKVAFFADFVQRARFTTAFPTTLTPAQFVDQLNTNAGNVLSAGERTTAINLFGGAGNTTNATARAQALRQVSEDPELFAAEFNRAFVLMQYYGYLRRNPDDPPEGTLDYAGYEFWLIKLNQANGNYNDAEMVKAFLSSIEYNHRFGP